MDAYEWVVTPNVIGMGLNADGGQTATKPYIASANYIARMSDYCAGCRYNPKLRSGEDACPFNFLYWNFLRRHEAALRANPRFGPAVLGLQHLSDDDPRPCGARLSSFWPHWHTLLVPTLRVGMSQRRSAPRRRRSAPRTVLRPKQIYFRLGEGDPPWA